jgi:hypothetical protein
VQADFDFGAGPPLASEGGQGLSRPIMVTKRGYLGKPCEIEQVNVFHAVRSVQCKQVRRNIASDLSSQRAIFDMTILPPTKTIGRGLVM